MFPSPPEPAFYYLSRVLAFFLWRNSFPEVKKLFKKRRVALRRRALQKRKRFKKEKNFFSFEKFFPRSKKAFSRKEE